MRSRNGLVVENRFPFPEEINDVTRSRIAENRFPFPEEIPPKYPLPLPVRLPSSEFLKK
jgi:hypothetical protein